MEKEGNGIKARKRRKKGKYERKDWPLNFNGNFQRNYLTFIIVDLF
jgi:hypothetical protein